MIYTKLHGRTGNHLFEIAAAATLAAKNNAQFCAVCHEDYKLAPPDNCSIWEFIQPYRNNLYRNVTIWEKSPEIEHKFKQSNFEYKPIEYKNNLLLDGAFQSFKYIAPDIAIGLFSIPETIKIKINAKYGHLLSLDPVAVNVRRGDYLIIPHKFPVCSKDYFMKAIKLIGGKENFLFISDDIEWCKKNFKGSNYFFFENNDPLLDLYAQSLCKHNIISNSSFSWWGAYLNPREGRKVIYPTPWFGQSQEVRMHDVKDLCPPEWIRLKNNMAFALKVKAAYALLKEKAVAIKNNIFRRK